MNCESLFQLKARLLCYGIKADSPTKQYMQLINQYVLDTGFIHAAHFLINDLVINTCISESFCENSPFTIKLNSGKLELFENDVFITDIDVLPLPKWCEKYVDGYRIGDYLRPHSKQCLACWPYLKCNYYEIGKPCQFCSMGDYKIRTIIPESVVAEMIRIALLNNKEYDIALSGGTCHEPDHSINYFSSIASKARDYGAKYISVEIAPPNDLFYIDELKKSGATAIIMNLEIADDTLRKKLCPGKSSISEIHYFHAYERAIQQFGVGNVSCVLISGIQKPEDIISKSEQLINLGVIPTIIPFKPLDGCAMKSHATADPNELIFIATEIEKLLIRHNLTASEQRGCTKCNGCSLETAIEFSRGVEK